MTRRLVVEADGGSRGNPARPGTGRWSPTRRPARCWPSCTTASGTTTNNVAEYSGLVAGLRAAGELAPGADVEVRMDSKLVVEQMSGRWKIKDPNLRKLAASARQAAGRLGRVSYTWVPRARNTRADRLANQAMDAAAGSSRARRPVGVSAAPADGRSAEWRRRGAGQPQAAGARVLRRTSRVRGRFLSGPRAAGRARGRGWGPARGPATTTLLLRHGQTPLSAERRFAGRGDIPLTDDGPQQAAAAAARLRARGGIDVIVSVAAAPRAAHGRGGRGGHRARRWSSTTTWSRPTSASGRGCRSPRRARSRRTR